MDAPPTASLRVIYGDTDQMGVVYYANYLRYFEVARNEWLRARGHDYRSFEAEGRFIPVVEVQVRYRSPARYDDLLDIYTRPIEFRNGSVRFSYALHRQSDQTLLTEGQTLHACIGRDGRPTRFPEWLLELLAKDGARDARSE